jgi:hypothetical protein
MKKSIFMLLTLVASLLSSAKINQKVLEVFQQSFKDARNVVWHEYQTRYEVDFTQNEIITHIVYDFDGNVMRTIRYYHKEQLPPYILCKLEKRYPNLSVFGITEIYNSDAVEYFIKMEDEKHWYTIKSDSLGSFEETERFKKAGTPSPVNK